MKAKDRDEELISENYFLAKEVLELESRLGELKAQAAIDEKELIELRKLKRLKDFSDLYSAEANPAGKQIADLMGQLDELRAESALDRKKIAEFSKLKQLEVFSELYWQIDLRTANQPRQVQSQVRLNVLDEVMDELLHTKRRTTLLQEWLSGNPHCLPTFMQEEILAWIFSHARPQSLEVEGGYLHLMGDGPWDVDVYGRLMEQCNFTLWALPDAEISHVIVGRNSWNEDLLAQHIAERRFKPLRVYSQEMWFATLLTGSDPYDTSDSALIKQFAYGHAAMEYACEADNSAHGCGG
jgi:hypothetical protein